MLAVVAPGQLLVLLQTLLRQIEGLLAHDAGDPYGDPIFYRGGPLALAWPHRLQCRFASPGRRWMGASTIGGTSISRRAQNAAHRGDVPAQTAARGRNLPLTQGFRNPVQRRWHLRISVPGKNLLDNLGFDRIQPDSTGITWALRIQNVAIRRRRPRQQGPAAQFGLAPPAHPLGDQAPFVLRDGTANLQQELVVRVITHRSIQELNLTAPALHFIDQQHLMHVLARQTIRGGDQYQLKGTQCRMIAQMIQTRTIQRGAAIAVIPIHVCFSQVPICLHRDLGPQPGQLLLNRLRLLLAAGRDPHVQSNLHDSPPRMMMGQAQHLQVSPLPNAGETGRHNPSGVDHRCGWLRNGSRAMMTSCILPVGDWTPGRILPSVSRRRFAIVGAVATTTVRARPAESGRICHL